MELTTKGWNAVTYKDQINLEMVTKWIELNPDNETYNVHQVRKFKVTYTFVDGRTEKSLFDTYGEAVNWYKKQRREESRARKKGNI